jgi:surface carbohydrate biosynthesis protein
MRIGLVVDHPHRDLEGIVLLARALSARGAEPALVPMYQQGLEQALLRLDAIVVNYYRPNNAQAMRHWRAQSLATFVLDTEGGVLSESGHDSPEAFAGALKGLKVADGVDGYLFWGERLAGAVAASGALPEERIAVTGCPRFDLCAEPWRRRLGERRADYVLINTNFSLINPAHARAHPARRSAAGLPPAAREMAVMVAGGWDKEYVASLVGDLRAVFARYLAFLVALAASLPGTRFRLRPHPFEDHGVYLEHFSGLANVEVNGEGSVAAAVRGAILMLHLNCGSAIETALLDCVPVQLEFLNTPLQRAHTPLPGRISHRAEGPEEVRRLIAGGERLSAVDATAVRAELAPFFGALDGRAGDRAADFIMGRLRRHRCRRAWPMFSGALRDGTGARPGQIVQAALGKALGTAAVARLRELLVPARRNKRLSAARVGGLLAELASCEGGRSTPLKALRARHRLTRLPLESILIAPAAPAAARRGAPPKTRPGAWAARSKSSPGKISSGKIFSGKHHAMALRNRRVGGGGRPKARKRHRDSQ